ANSRYGDGRLRRGLQGSVRLRDVLIADPLAPYPGGPEPLSDVAEPEDRRDVLCYTSDLLESSLDVVGEPVVDVSVRADCRTFDLVASLVYVDTTGQPRRLSCGARRLEEVQPEEI